MSKQTEALKLALEGAANYIDALGGDSRKYRQALAEQPAQQQEPVAWISEVRCVGPEYGKKRYGALPVQSLQPGYYAHTPLYTSPPASKPWVGLTEQEAAECWSTSTVRTWQAIEAKLREKNT